MDDLSKVLPHLVLLLDFITDTISNNPDLTIFIKGQQCVDFLRKFNIFNVESIMMSLFYQSFVQFVLIAANCCQFVECIHHQCTIFYRETNNVTFSTKTSTGLVLDVPLNTGDLCSAESGCVDQGCGLQNIPDLYSKRV